jgi:hypothetical protein
MTNSLSLQFISWYFVYFPVRILENGRYFAIWCWRFFSIGFFLPRLFSPWHKDITGYGRGFSLSTWSHTLAWNFISRFIGAILRVCSILLGLVMEAVIIVTTIWLFALWFALPVIAIYLFVSAF